MELPTEPHRAITIFRGWDSPGKYVWSPFVTKLELRLRLAGVKYKVECGSVRASPKGKIPYITIPDRNDALSDSTLISQEMVETGQLDDINAALTPAQQAQDLALRALMEDRLYFYHTRERWIDNYYTMRDHILSAIPYPVRVVVGILIHRGTVQTLHGQGTGRFSAEEMASFRLQIWQSVNSLLEESKQQCSKELKDPFWVMGGLGPTEADCVVYAFVVSVMVCAAAPESQKVVRSFPTVVEYANRIHQRYFPDYELWEEE